MQHIYHLFDEFVEPGLTWVRKNAKEAVPSTDLNLVTSLCYLFQAMFTKVLSPNTVLMPMQYRKKVLILRKQKKSFITLSIYFLFSVMYGPLAAIFWDCTKKISMLLREIY